MSDQGALAAAAARISALEQERDAAVARANAAEATGKADAAEVVTLRAAQAPLRQQLTQAQTDLADAKAVAEQAAKDGAAALAAAIGERDAAVSARDTATATSAAAIGERDAAVSARDTVNAKLTAALDDLAATKATLAEAGKPLPPPAPDSGIVTVIYSDGRVKYAAPDGTKFGIAADAERHIKILRVVDKGGILERDAARLVDAGILALDPVKP